MASAQVKEKVAAKKFQKTYFDVLGLCCSSEVPLIENILKPLEGVKEVSVIVPSRTVIVVHDILLISQLQIVKALNQARLEANVRVYGAGDSYKKTWPSPYAIGSGVLLVLSFLKYTYRPLGWLALGAVALGIFPIAMKGFASIRNFRFHDINILVIIAVVGTIALKDYTEAASIVFLFIIAEWLQSCAGYRAKAVMSSLMSMAPRKAVLAENGEVVDVDEVKLNTILAVKAGEVIPIDGIVVEGKSEVDEKTLTGESYPVAKEKDSTVWAGTINLNGYISVKTTALAEDCAVAKMVKLVEEAQNSKTRTQRFIDKCAMFYTPAVLVISVSIAVIPAALHVHNWSKWFHLALVVLVSACPCGLILSTPVVTFCTLTKAATSGLLIKGGDYVEILAKVKIMAFDKTGTITRGEFVVMDFQSLRDDISLNTLLYWVASIERKSSHPMADALVDYGRSLSIEPKPENVEEFQNFPGEGIHGKIDGQDIYIGNRKIALRAACEIVPTTEGSNGGKTIGYIYSGGTPTGVFTISDACRSGAAEAIRELKKLGIKTAMLTGDSNAASLHTNEQLKQALEVVHAELLPEDKARIVKEFKTEGNTAMVGDGINDAPALATADIGISMGISGSALAQETGNIILLSNDIRKLPKAVRLARRANRKVVENVVLSITTKVGILALGFAGHPLVWAAVLADVGTCMLVIFNSMLLLQGTQKHGGSTSAPHAHKHGSHGHSLSHKNQHCCSDSKPVKACEPQKCSSQCQPTPLNSSLPCMLKCSDDLRKARHCDEASCMKVNKDLESQNKHNHGFLSHHNLSSCAEGDKIHEAKHCDGSASSLVEIPKLTSKGHCHSTHCSKEHSTKESDGVHEEKHCNHSIFSLDESKRLTDSDISHSRNCGKERSRKEGDAIHEPKHCNHSAFSMEECQKLTSTGHCHSTHCGKDHIHNEALGETFATSCDHQRHCNLDENSPPYTTIDIVTGCDQAESAPTKSCIGSGTMEKEVCCSESVASQACVLEKREVGGCCKSYMKECCGSHGHIGSSFKGCSSEITIE
ncbi:putative inactive cadmium/zinc-transporting ATPase HMA3 isoform X1 [Pyrus x bretschneideri]|uniref:putative inactive cadmium/zinc-transporting ATPase HMA3 isoform X1 n=1 Tax=Pyrus x bretschneideri TaxID=225117 RepID=UPI0020302E02|nr:putative inactive cadmium/zinc-transporting ATPase HMA3 isoform X1 [Pyrus x bretschneideri]XP_009344844.2 putative inactive cadmium/zinc-transporting ATPase HMA3 isoform X1 [Pyrus x bretschneideri]XP_048447922.1 putative inactive cadmium/zinc-transporting ATPase HMA3 isoform X1 [Pyrus x bretschneideri]